MLTRAIALSLCLVPAFAAVACGGKTPPPADESTAEGDTKASKGDDSSGTSGGAAPAASSDTSDGAPSASAAPAASASPAPASSSAGLDTSVATKGDDPWLASHQMPPKDVIKTMKAANAKVQTCWKEGRKRDPSASGEVKIRFVVTNDGAVRAWKDDGSSMTDGEVTQCVGDVLNKLKFPKQKSPGDAWGVYSINFTP
jgi:hypothetical protein